MPSWDSVRLTILWTEACGKNRWLEPAEDLENGIRRLSNSRLWQCRNDASKSLVEYARDGFCGTLAASGASPDAVEEAKHLLIRML